MPLRLTLKPHERVILGGAVVRNGDKRSGFLIENEIPVLRETDILSPRTARTACERLYLTLQLMYVDPERMDLHRKTFDHMAENILEAAPSCGPHLEATVDLVEAGRLYQALKRAQLLLEHEKELIHHVS